MIITRCISITLHEVGFNLWPMRIFTIRMADAEDTSQAHNRQILSITLAQYMEDANKVMSLLRGNLLRNSDTYQDTWLCERNWHPKRCLDLQSEHLHDL